MIQIRLALIFLLNYVHFIHTYNTKLHYFNKQTKQITKLTCVSYLTLLWKNLLYSCSSDVYRNVKHWLQSLINEFTTSHATKHSNLVRQPQNNPVAFHCCHLPSSSFPRCNSVFQMSVLLIDFKSKFRTNKQNKVAKGSFQCGKNCITCRYITDGHNLSDFFSHWGNENYS